MSATSIDGLLLVDKPAGPTSQDVVTIAKRAARAERAGHTGTLDPFATGLLVVLFGRATRLAAHVPGEPKVYDATVRFGSETDTDDATGAPVRAASPPTFDAIREAIVRLTGAIEQIPPSYSAKQLGGARAHAAARAGAPLALAPVSVTVHTWQLIDYASGELRATISCSGGTYIRALARDLGVLTGSAAHLAALRRSRSGPFAVDDAVPLEQVRAGEFRVLPAVAALPDVPQTRLDDAGVNALRQGRAIAAAAEHPRTAIVDAHGDFVALADRDGDRWQPRVVFPV